MVGCSSPYSSRNNAKYYAEIGKYFQAMLDLEGSEKLKEAFKKCSDIEDMYEKKRGVKYQKSNEIKERIESISKEINEIQIPIKDLENEID